MNREPRSAAPPGAVLWDLDGTLVESAEHHWQAWLETLADHGVSITRAQFVASFGQRNDAILSQWLGPQGAPGVVRDIGDTKEARYRTLVAERGVTPLPGAAEWVRRLADRGWRQAVASSAPRRNVEVVLAGLGLGEQFQALVAAEDVRHGKPAPDVFLHAAGQLRVPPDRCVVVEDAPAGIEAARRAGMRSIGIGPTGFAPADVVVTSLVDLPLDAFDKLITP